MGSQAYVIQLLREPLWDEIRALLELVEGGPESGGGNGGNNGGRYRDGDGDRDRDS